MGAGHSHSHSHESGPSWKDLSGDGVFRSVLAFIQAVAVVTLIGVMMLWPDGQGQDEAKVQATEIGLGAERLSAKVEKIEDNECSFSDPANPQNCREISFILDEGPEAGALIILPEFNVDQQKAPPISVGDTAILGFQPSTNTYFYADQERRLPLVALTVLFALVVMALGRFRGVLALVGMAFTVAVLVVFVAPSVLDGNDPLLVSLAAASIIAFVSLYLSHGFSPTTTVALAGTLGSLLLTFAISWVFFELANFTGLATEEGLTIPLIASDINLSSLLLGGAMLGALGALDDVTVTQVAAVSEVRRQSPKISTGDLVASGIRVGREHIASTVNTLLLAYAGASMPILLLFAVSNQSLGMVANSEVVAVEIVRTLCGSIGLVAAVPLTTFLAAVISGRGKLGSEAS